VKVLLRPILTTKLRRVGLAVLTLLAAGNSLLAQDPASAPTDTLPPPSVSEKWNVFQHETVTPLMIGAGAIDAAYSQTIHSTPLYGRHWGSAYPQRFGAAMADIASQDFFGDFVLASAFHEDTRYRRRGSTYKFWNRVTYAVSRALVTKSDAGQATFNWANVFGTAMSAGLSNAYYPDVSRTAPAAATNWGKTLGDSGLANLLPEFWPDFRQWVKKHLLSRSH
jgi:hypothetical protein